MATTNTDTEKVEQSTSEKARQEAGPVGDVAKEEVSHLVDEATDQGRGLLSETSERLKGEAQNQSRHAWPRTCELSRVICARWRSRQTSQELR